MNLNQKAVFPGTIFLKTGPQEAKSTEGDGDSARAGPGRPEFKFLLSHRVLCIISCLSDS